MDEDAQHVAVGVDETPEALAAARWAAAVVARRGGRLLLVHGYLLPAIYPPTAGAEVTVLKAVQDEIVSEIADVLRREQPTITMSTLVERQPVVPLLKDVSTQVDLLVLGHHRAGWVERLISGSVSSALSARAHCPVVTVPYGNLAEHGPVVIALDVEAQSEQAMKLAFDRAKYTDQSVTVIHAVPDSAPAAELEQLYAQIADSIKPWRARYPACEVRIQLVNGSPHHTLVEAVPQASLLIVTRPRAGAMSGGWIRSVSRAAQRQATCPIAMVNHT